MTALEKLFAEKKYALTAIFLVFIGIFILGLSDSVLIGILRVILFIAVAFLIYFFPRSSKSSIPEPQSEEEYEKALKMALEKRQQAQGSPELSKSKETEYYIPKQELPENLMDQAESDFEQMVNHMMEMSKSALSADSVGFYLLDGSAQNFHLKQFTVNEGFSLNPEVPKGNSLLDSVVLNNRVLMENHIPQQSNAVNYHQTDTQRGDLLQGQGKIFSFIGAPVHYKEKAIGLVFADSGTKDNFSESDKKYLNNLAGTISNGIANTDRLYETASFAKSYSIFEKLNQQLAASLTSKEIFDVITEYVIQNYSADRLTISTLAGTGELIVEQIVGPKDIVRPGDILDIGDGLVGLLVRQRKPLMIGNVDSNRGEYTARFYKNEPHGHPMSSFLGVPALNAGRVIAVITLESFHLDNYDEDDKNLLMAMAGHVALALSRGHMLKTLEELTVRDDTTGAWNEKGFAQRFHEEKARSKRFKAKFTLIKLDFDHFTHIQNTYGKSAANALLSEFSRLTKELIRSVDFLARLHNDVFILILPSTSSFGAKILSERIRNKVAEKHFYIEGGVIQATLSGAILEVPDMGEEDKDILDKLEKTLKYAKSKKGNQILLYTNTVEFPDQGENS